VLVNVAFADIFVESGTRNPSIMGTGVLTVFGGPYCVWVQLELGEHRKLVGTIEQEKLNKAQLT